MRADPIYRAPMRARSLEAGPYSGARYGVASSLTGTGEPLSRTPSDLDEALFLTEEEHGAKSMRMLKRFATLPEDTLVWTRTDEDEFRLGRLGGGWFYDESPEAVESGIRQVRPTRWLSSAFTRVTVPAAVAATFSRGGRNMQRIRDRAAEAESASVWCHGAD